MTVYQPGHIKRDPATQASATRTSFPEDRMPRSAWLVATLDMGATNAQTSEVEDWDDVYVPPEPEASP